MTGRPDPALDLPARDRERTVRALRDFHAFAEQGARLILRGRAAYDADEMMRLAAEAIIVKLGAAVSRMHQRFIDGHPELPLRVIKDMRNLVAHEYDAVRPDLIWNALTHELPAVSRLIADLLRAEPE